MSKPRRLAEIRAQAAAKTARLRAEIEARENFTLPRPKSWRAIILIHIAKGRSLRDAAHLAGVSRGGLRHARMIDPDFATAFEAAHRTGLRARFAKSKQPKPSHQLNDKMKRFNGEKPPTAQIHCNLGSVKLTRKRCNLLTGIAPVALALPWQKSLISQQSRRMVRAL